eukprot:94141-Pelagomonas_calceolata.AAC.1
MHTPHRGCGQTSCKTFLRGPCKQKKKEQIGHLCGPNKSSHVQVCIGVETTKPGAAQKEERKRKRKEELRRRAEETLPTSIKEKETRWLKRAMSPLHHKGGKRRASGGLEGC